MTVNNKRVFYVKYLAHTIYADILKARADVRLDRLENESPENVFTPVIERAHAYQVGAARDELAPHFHVHSDLLKRAPNLLIVSSNGAGFDPVDVEACTKAGVLVLNQSGGNAHSVAEHALAMLLTLSKRVIEADRALRRERDVDRNGLIGTEARGRTIGIVGIGHVGRRIAELCTGLLGMRVVAYDPYLSAGEIAARGAEQVELDDLLRRSDYVSINCPLTKESRGMIGAREFALMQPHAYFITTARGSFTTRTRFCKPCVRGALRAPGSTSGRRSRRRRSIRCCNSTTCWRARIPQASPGKPDKIWAASPPNSFSMRSTGRGRRASSTRKSGHATASDLHAPLV
jgi:D-3-phosphoglycerate dehydrogenase